MSFTWRWWGVLMVRIAFFERRDFIVSFQRGSVVCDCLRRIQILLTVVNLTIHWPFDVPHSGCPATGTRIYSVHWCSGRLIFTFGLDPYEWNDTDPRWRRISIRLWRRDA